MSVDGERIKEVIVDSRINKVLAMRTDSVAMLEALDAISEFYVSNTVDARRMLRQDLELQNINLAKKFLGEFENVRNRIDEVQSLSEKLETACGGLASRVKDADENMKSFMEKASQLENKRNFYQAQSKEINMFLSRFQLSNAEIDLLYHANIDSSESANAFFEVLHRLKSAYADCKNMVEQHCYTVGFELLEVLGQHQDRAYQHLFEWVKGKCEALSESGATDDMDTNTKLQISIRFLKKLPIYFDQCQDLLVNSRRTQLVQRFAVALTQGDGSSGAAVTAGGGSSAANSASSSKHQHPSSRALDLHAHDAARYVGGMLAWMHQAVASEMEFLEAIFGDVSSELQPKKRNNRTASAESKLHGASHDENDVGSQGTEDGDVSPQDTRSDSQKVGLTIPELLARCVQGLGRPLRVRILQTLETKSSLEVLYSLTDLLSFYQETFLRITPTENAVHSAVKGSLNECRRMFLSALNKQGQSLLASPVTYPLDLKASHVTRECAVQVKEILRVCSTALSVVSCDPSDPCHIDSVLGSIIEPLLQSCRLGGQALQPAEMAIFMLNNVSVLQHEITEASKRSKQTYSSSAWLGLLQTEVSTWVDILVKEEAARALRRSDIDKLLELIEVLPSDLRAVEQMGLSSDRVSTVLRAFYASLFSTVTSQFERLQDPALREVMRSGIAEQVADAHAKIHRFVSQESNG
eukprot:CAMPEP_0185015088 /NCGR_PEP_ID=MMETSP1098-20130426/99657_1 /TAXON_ID=89044 /ORGANISM="Spumella elongata, Strain CCAP 955/1" /LENGTH=696 /DNA_ID=CAMNT_0027544203 /DNA_START=42 /DNA_END=2129 /DNA_ORIENTATION=+